MGAAEVKFETHPKTLEEAIDRILGSAMGRDFRKNSHDIIRNFLAQKFCTAQFQHPDCADVLTKLFKECTKKDGKK
jgi:hypothetical protein